MEVLIATKKERPVQRVASHPCGVDKQRLSSLDTNCAQQLHEELAYLWTQLKGQWAGAKIIPLSFFFFRWCFSSDVDLAQILVTFLKAAMFWEGKERGWGVWRPQ